MRLALRLLAFVVFTGCGGDLQGPAKGPARERPKVRAFGTDCSKDRTLDELDLMSWDPGRRANLSMIRAWGPVLVHYEGKGCDGDLEVVDECSAPGGYRFTPYSASDSVQIEDRSELSARMPIGGAALGGQLRAEHVLRADYQLVGIAALGPNHGITGDALRGHACKRATHVVTKIYLGGFVLASARRDSVSAGVNLFAIGVNGTKTAGVSFLTTEGDAATCKKALGLGVHQQLCSVPLRVALTPLAKRTELRRPDSMGSAEFEYLVAREVAKDAHGRLELLIRPPPYLGDGSKPDVLAYLRGPALAWVTAMRPALDRAKDATTDVVKKAPDGVAKVEALDQHAWAQLRVAEAFLNLPLPNALREDDDQRAAYRSALGDLAKNSLDAAFLAADLCVLIATKKQLDNVATRRCLDAQARARSLAPESSFPCGPALCAVGQRCCPGAAKACVGKDEECGIGSDTTVGYLCDPKSNRPCPEGKRCVAGKVGTGPLTMTAECR